MTIKGIKTSVAALALTLAAAGIGGQAFAQDYHGRGYDRGHDVGRGDDHGRGYNSAGVDAQKRFGQVRWEALQLTQSGRIDRRESDRAMNMLKDISRQFQVARLDGRLSQGEVNALNARLDGVESFLRNARDDGRRGRRG